MEDKIANANDPRAIRSREALHQALLTLLETKSLEQITIRDIAAESGVGYTTYFRHYPTKEALFEAVASQQIRNIFELSIPLVATKDMHTASMALFSYVREHAALWTPLLTGGAAGTMRDQFLRHAKAIAKAYKDPKRWMPPEMGVLLIVSGTIEILTWWLQSSKPLPLERIVDIHVRVVVSPVVAAGEGPPPDLSPSTFKLKAAPRKR